MGAQRRLIACPFCGSEGRRKRAPHLETVRYCVHGPFGPWLGDELPAGVQREVHKYRAYRDPTQDAEMYDISDYMIDIHYVACGCCGMQGPVAPTKVLARQRWNLRALIEDVFMPGPGSKRIKLFPRPSIPSLN